MNAEIFYYLYNTKTKILMGNLSYCRWHNTFFDLQDCLENLQENCSKEDLQYKKALLEAIIECVESGDAQKGLESAREKLRYLY